jgi:hypothetical protein
MRKARPFLSEPSCSPASFRARRSRPERVVCNTERRHLNTRLMLNNQQTPFRRCEAGGLSAPTLKTAGRSPAPYAARAVFSSRHRSHRRRIAIGTIHERVVSLFRLSRPPFSGREQCTGRPARNQVQALPINQYYEAPEALHDRHWSGLWRPSLWLYVPTQTSLANCSVLPSALDMPALISDCISQNQTIELSVMSREKSMPRQLSWRGWLTRPWLRHLFGTISNPSAANHGAAAFISSLPVIPANRSAFQAAVKEKATRATSGQQLPELCESASLNGSLPKMSKATQIWDLPPSGTSLQPWAIAQKRACSARLKRGLATGAIASSFWPTPTAQDSGNPADLKIENGIIKIVKAVGLNPRNMGQYPLQNAARAWTIFWQTLQALGWQPEARMASSHPVRLSFTIGHNSYHTSLKPNPRFYEKMMGWPDMWSEPEAQVTEFAAWLRRSRGLFSNLLSNWKRDNGL